MTKRKLTITAKRQATLPPALCEELGVGPGETLTLERRELDGETVWNPAMRIIGLLLWLTLPSLAQGQSPAPTAPPFSTTRGAFFALSVADLEASSRWYSEKLGLTVVMEVPRTDRTAVTVLEGGGLIVELIQNDDAKPASDAPGASDPTLVHGIVKVGIVVADLDEMLALLKARGVEIAMGPFPARGSQRSNALIRDNSGNLIQLFGR